MNLYICCQANVSEYKSTGKENTQEKYLTTVLMYSTWVIVMLSATGVRWILSLSDDINGVDRTFNPPQYGTDYKRQSDRQSKYVKAFIQSIQSF